MIGSLGVTDRIEVLIDGLFVMGLTLLITASVALLLFARAGACRSSTVIAKSHHRQRWAWKSTQQITGSLFARLRHCHHHSNAVTMIG